jgi:hypothetical protein
LKWEALGGVLIAEVTMWIRFSGENPGELMLEVSQNCFLGVSKVEEIPGDWHGRPTPPPPFPLAGVLFFGVEWDFLAWVRTRAEAVVVELTVMVAWVIFADFRVDFAGEAGAGEWSEALVFLFLGRYL